MAVLTHEQWLVHKQRIRRFDRLERENKRLQTEVRRLRELLAEARVIVAVMADPNAYAPWRRKVARALLPEIDAALTASGQERGEGA